MLIRNTNAAVRQGTRVARPGFTLMEIMVVVAIIVILAGAATVYVIPMLGKSKDGMAKVGVTTLTQAATIYQTNNGSPPPSLESLAQQQPDGGKPLVAAKDLLDPWDQPYQYDPSGSHNAGAQVDIWTVSKDSGKTIGNWANK